MTTPPNITTDSEVARLRAAIDAYDADMWKSIGLDDTGGGWKLYANYGADFPDYNKLCDQYCDATEAAERAS